MRFQEKVAIVTGGASGIGAATARGLLAEGAKVVVVDMNSAALQKMEMEAEMKEAGYPFLGIIADVADERVANLIEKQFLIYPLLL